MPPIVESPGFGVSALITDVRLQNESGHLRFSGQEDAETPTTATCTPMLSYSLNLENLRTPPTIFESFEAVFDYAIVRDDLQHHDPDGINLIARNFVRINDPRKR
jgi:hypothetical protein